MQVSDDAAVSGNEDSGPERFRGTGFIRPQNESDAVTVSRRDRDGFDCLNGVTDPIARSQWRMKVFRYPSASADRQLVDLRSSARE